MLLFLLALWLCLADGLVVVAVSRPCAPRRSSIERRALGNDALSDLGTSLIVAASGLGVLLGAGSLIAGAYEGEKGLGAFLRDGEGYQKSGYKDDKLEARRMKAPDFLDKVSLPAFDFVQVYSGEENAVEQAENLRKELSKTLDLGDVDKARQIERKLNKVMRDNGLRYDDDDESGDEQQRSA